MENYGILLVDDEPAYHAIVAALLAPHGLEIDCAGDAAAALSAVRAKRYDLILMDMEMPDMDGYHALAPVRAAADWAQQIPIIAFTTLSPDGGERHFIERGFDGWLAKPFEAGALHALLEHWLGAGTLAVVGGARGGEQLAALLGIEAATGMIGRFYASLAEAVAAIDAGGDAAAAGHRLGGLAGTLGFPALSAAWLSLQHEQGVWSTVRALTVEALSGQGGAAL